MAAVAYANVMGSTLSFMFERRQHCEYIRSWRALIYPTIEESIGSTFEYGHSNQLSATAFDQINYAIWPPCKYSSNEQGMLQSSETRTHTHTHTR